MAYVFNPFTGTLDNVGVSKTISGDYLPLSGGTLSGNLTVVGNVSSNSTIYANGGDSNVWNSTKTTVQSNSASWATDSTTDAGVRALTSFWDSTYTTVGTNSANWQEAYTFVNTNSANLSATNIYVSNDLTVVDTVSAKYYQGTILDWMTLVRGYKTTPTLNTTIAGGDVYNYVYSTSGSDKTYYRYIATDGSEDSFYETFSGGVLSNKITTKSIIL